MCVKIKIYIKIKFQIFYLYCIIIPIIIIEYFIIERNYMSDSTENTNELDSYGVWVKNTNEESGSDDLNFADSLDLPDFEETDSIDDGDFSDMFKEDDSINLDSMSDDTTLTDDELMNITSGDGIQLEETSGDAITDDDLDFNTEISDDSAADDSLDDISFDSLEENSVSEADLSSFEDVSIEEPVPETEESTDDDFVFEETPAEEPAVEEAPVEPIEEPAAEESVEEMNIEDFGVEESSEGGEEEISLDDFMDSGFSSDAPASESSGLTADAAPSASDSEEVSLDDFVDMSEFGIEEEAPKKEEQIADEKPLDMDISFDSSADTISTEENIDSDSDVLDDDFQEEEVAAQPEVETESVDVSSFGNDIESEEVDLSDFGIDADAEETPVTQDVEGEKNKETVVDYDLSVGDGNMNTAPVVNEIKSSVEDVAEAEELPEEVAVSEPAATSNVDNSLLQQIVADLSNLKNEINTLKNNLEEMKAAPAPAPASDSQSIISEEIAVEEPVIEEDSKEDTGFFSGDDGDDTIALSTDELSNILNTADFSETEEPVVEAEPAIEEETFVEEPVVEETPAETTIEDHVEDNAIGEEVSEEAIGAIADTQEDINFDFGEDNLSEPNLDDIELDEEVLEDDLPDEIEISKEDDILVESSSSDFMDSVQDTTDEHTDEGVVEEIEDEAPAAEEETSEPEDFTIEDENFSTVDNLFDQPEISEIENITAEPAAEEAPVEEEVTIEEEAPAEPEIEVQEEEPVVEETVEEPIVEEEPVIEDETFVEEPVIETAPIADIENDFVSHEDDNNELTDSNIDYLTTEETPAEETVDENAELKKDIKSVLLYMDQLLENLPEEKIVEFAKSDEFTTYKKLFSELGLS